MINLIKIIDRNQDSHNLGRNFTFDASRLRKPHKRSEASKYLPCEKSRSRCRQLGGRFVSRCYPPSSSRGFVGVGAYSGQKLRRSSGTRIHGRYSRHPGDSQKWRIPGRLSKVRWEIYFKSPVLDKLVQDVTLRFVTLDDETTIQINIEKGYSPFFLMNAHFLFGPTVNHMHTLANRVEKNVWIFEKRHFWRTHLVIIFVCYN